MELQVGIYLGRWGQWDEVDLLYSGSTEEVLRGKRVVTRLLQIRCI